MSMGLIAARATPEPMRPKGWWQCDRCGRSSTNGKPPEDRLCGSCRDVAAAERSARRIGKVVREISYGGFDKPCRAWRRGFDEHDNPINRDGTPVIVGERRCGHRDCVEPSHIDVEEASVA